MRKLAMLESALCLLIGNEWHFCFEADVLHSFLRMLML